ncbi:hypothetical protein FJO98_10325 [Enterococcus sp. PF-2]|nr:hypothetical protein CXM95_08960 [Enterococcus sp. CR-Ec1]AVC42341.1 hypothetical protein AL523_18285 [Enterococcus gallinarum]EPH67117.1 hypothetical protein D931_00845 [Enterococcus faecium 13.SD.W.09]EPH95000.1 hypothetical protein D922_01427 [Enterococcus faecalis 06-MB-DW-09]MBO1097546.1 hypothetical protein [Enterococcus casseliflavus]TPE02351.1 hypothetical protein FJP08_11895 [Enterococcus sp. PF-3]TPE25300.1 hypothetical protein FJO98_10325 [Enterococcus sp. PF-2]
MQLIPCFSFFILLFLLTFFVFSFLRFLRTKKATAYVTAIASKQKPHRRLSYAAINSTTSIDTAL